MCSISGGTRWDDISEYIWEKSKDRGRDDAGLVFARGGAWIGNRRATPTTEVENPIERQPVGDDMWRYVFNGIIANDKELGVAEGEADTSVLPRVISPGTPFEQGGWLEKFAEGIQRIKGSFAIAAMNMASGTTLLACNYKPIWILEKDGHFYFSSLKQHFPPHLHPYRMSPYSVRFLTRNIEISLPRIQYNRALVICSSGLDSTAVAAYARYMHEKTCLIHFDYGCLATARETASVKKIAEYLECEYKIIKMAESIFGESPLHKVGSEIAAGITGAEYAHEWVPARNLVMLSVATAYAEANKYGYIYLGTNLEEAGAYPDNEEQFILDFNSLMYGAVQNGIKVEVKTPLGGLMKHEIVPFGQKYGAPFHLTWSCYKGGKKHCGKCGPCFMRRTAFERNNLVDPVEYED